MGKHTRKFTFMTETPVSNQDVYAEVIGMRAEMRTMFTEIAVMKASNTDRDIIRADHESRLRGIESDVIRIRVIASTIATIAGILSGAISAILTHAH